MRESTVEEACVSYASSRGWLCRKLKWIGRRDAPDRLFVRQGRVVFVEFKAPGETPRPTQDREHAILRGYGCQVRVYDSFEHFAGDFS